MRRILLVLFLLLSVPVSSQVDTTRALSFFPLQEGNRWEYRVIYSWWIGPPDTTYETMEVTGDTLITFERGLTANDTVVVQRKYSVVEGWPFSFDFYRIDTLNLAVYAYDEWCPGNEIKLMDLNPPSGYSYYTSCGNVSIESQTGNNQVGLLPDTADYYRFEMFHNGSQGHEIYEGYGLVVYNQGAFSSFSEGHAGYLLAATINGQQYGDFTTGINNDPRTPPLEMRLHSNYPNPFNPSTTIPLEIIQSQLIALEVYDNLGRYVNTLKNGFVHAGYHEFTWDGRDSQGEAVGSGVYFVRLKAENEYYVQKMMLLR